MKSDLIQFTKDLQKLFREYPNLKTSSDLNEWGKKIDLLLKSTTLSTDSILFNQLNKYCSDIVGIIEKQSIQEFDSWIDSYSDLSDIKTMLDESWIEADECSNRSEWYEKIFQNDIDKLKKYFIEDYCMQISLEEIENDTDNELLN
tara:strand:- start:383 stop:820 length:438 start_codon:yes stop_codon:yes gene_type:complete